MTLSAGSVTVDEDEAHIGNGLSLALYVADKATAPLPVLPTLGQTTAPFSPTRPANAQDITFIQAARVTVLQEMARKATAYADAIVDHLKTNGVVTITTATSCGRVPSPNISGEPIDPPSSNVYLAIT